jgi:hypothetical protein
MISSLLSTIIITTIVSSTVTIIIKAIWEWASNKNGKKEMEIIKKDLKNEISKIKTEAREEMNSRFSVLEEIKREIINQSRNFVELKQLILLEYVRKPEFEKLNDLICRVRDIAIVNKNDVYNIKENCEKNCKLMEKFKNE